MKVSKKELNATLKVLGKMVCAGSAVEIYRKVHFQDNGNGTIHASTGNGNEQVIVKIDAITDVGEMVDYSVDYRELRERIRSARDIVEITDVTAETWPELETIPVDAEICPLSENFTELLAMAITAVSKQDYRAVLKGVNLSKEGIVATDGKQLIHLFGSFNLNESITLPFPLAILSADLHGTGTLATWDKDGSRYFSIKYEGFIWQGKVLNGIYPCWQRVIPHDEPDYSITFLNTDDIVSFLKAIPDVPPNNPIKLVIDGKQVTMTSPTNSNFKLLLNAEVNGKSEKAEVIINKHYLLRMMEHAYTSISTMQDGNEPLLCKGKYGEYVVMPISQVNVNQNESTTNPTETEDNKMENNQTNVVAAPVNEQSVVNENINPVNEINPMDELNNAIENLKGSLKSLMDETNLLGRKVKEVQIANKQKERDFIMAKRAIERIRMVSNF